MIIKRFIKKNEVNFLSFKSTNKGWMLIFFFYERFFEIHRVDWGSECVVGQNLTLLSLCTFLNKQQMKNSFHIFFSYVFSSFFFCVCGKGRNVLLGGLVVQNVKKKYCALCCRDEIEILKSSTGQRASHSIAQHHIYIHRRDEMRIE